MLWSAGRIPGVPQPLPEWTGGLPRDVWHGAWVVLSFASLPAYLALLRGYRRMALGLALLALGSSTVAILIEAATGEQPFLITLLAELVFNALLVLALGVATLAPAAPDAPPVRPRPWLLALPVGAAALAVEIYLTRPVDGMATLVLDLPGLWCVAIVAAGLVHLVGSAVGRVRAAPAWSVAFALLALGVLGLRLLTLVDYLLFDRGGGQRWSPLAVGLVEGAVVLAMAVPLTALASRALRGLSRTPAAAGRRA
jgi:hypothetical protein